MLNQLLESSRKRRLRSERTVVGTGRNNQGPCRLWQIRDGWRWVLDGLLAVENSAFLCRIL